MMTVSDRIGNYWTEAVADVAHSDINFTFFNIWNKEASGMGYLSQNDLTLFFVQPEYAAALRKNGQEWEPFVCEVLFYCQISHKKEE